MDSITCGTIVKVIAGFYLGCTGTVVKSYDTGFFVKHMKYQVIVTCKYVRDQVWIYEENLKVIDEK